MNNPTEKRNPLSLKMNKNNFQTYYCLPYNGRQPGITLSIIKKLSPKKIECISIDYRDNNKLVIEFQDSHDLLSFKSGRVLLCNTKTRELNVIHQKVWHTDFTDPIQYWEVTDNEGYTYEYNPYEYNKALRQLADKDNDGYTLHAVYWTEEELESLLDEVLSEEVNHDN